MSTGKFLKSSSCLVFSEFPGSDIDLGEILVHYFQSFFFSILPSSYGTPLHITPFAAVPQFLNITLCFSSSFSLFLFFFQFWGFLLRYPQAQRFFSQPFKFYNETIKGILHFGQCFISSISFWFFL